MSAHDNPKKQSPFANSPFYTADELPDPILEQPEDAPVDEPVPPPEEPAGAHEDPQEKDSPYEYQPTGFHRPYAPEPDPWTPPAKPAKQHGAATFWKGVLCAVLIVAMIAGSCYATATYMNQQWQEHLNQANATLAQMQNKLDQLQQEIKDNSYTGNGNSVSGTPNTGADGSLTPGQVYAQNYKAVVAIACSGVGTSNGQTAQFTSAGSGFLITADGYVITNHHVIDGATTIQVKMITGEQYDAKVVGYDAANDMAVLKVEASDLPYVKLGSSKDLIVGDQVVAIGNPLGELTNSLTVGYVSAKDRDISTGGALVNMIQTDVAINSGNSGGPLFNMKGEVVGITSAKYSGETSSGASIEGISFAIPIDDVLKKVNDLVQYGYLTGPYLGISVSDTDPTYADYFGIPSGAYVREVTPGYCAEKAGLKSKDVIVSLGGYEVTCMNDLARALEHFNAGDTVEVIVYRAGAQLTLSITLDERPPTTNTDVPSSTEPATGSDVPNQGSADDWWDRFFGDGN